MNTVLKLMCLFLPLQLTVKGETNPDDPWHQGSLESQGFSAAKLETLRPGLAARNTKGFLVIRDDTIAITLFFSRPPPRLSA